MKFTSGDKVTGVIEIASIYQNVRVFGKFFYLSVRSLSATPRTTP
jgi:hypothetical protein